MVFYHLSHCQPVTDFSATIIDYVLTNDITHCLEPGVIQTQVISDHYPLYCQISNVPTNKKAEESFGYYRDKSKFDSDSTFNEDLYQTLANYFSSVPDLTLNNFNEIFNEFYRLISKTISQYAPLKRYSRRQRKLLKNPWITKGILTSIKKNFMFKTHFLYGNASQKLFLKRYSNKLTKIKAMSKRSYIKSKLQNHQSDAKKTWEILRKLLPASGKTSQVLTAISQISEICGNCRVTDKCEEFNNFFCIIGKKFANNISLQSNKPFKFFKKSALLHLFFLSLRLSMKSWNSSVPLM